MKFIKKLEKKNFTVLNVDGKFIHTGNPSDWRLHRYKNIHKTPVPVIELNLEDRLIVQDSYNPVTQYRVITSDSIEQYIPHASLVTNIKNGNPIGNLFTFNKQGLEITLIEYNNK